MRALHPGHACRSLQRLVLVAMLVALPLYGVSSTLVALLGALHFHAPAPQLRLAVGTGAMAGWQDFRRAAPARTAHAAGVHAQAAHATLQRHHHDRHDHGVTALDAAGQTDAPSDRSPPSGTATLTLAAAPDAAPVTAPGPAHRWAVAPAGDFSSWSPGTLDRPPKG